VKDCGIMYSLLRTMEGIEFGVLQNIVGEDQYSIYIEQIKTFLTTVRTLLSEEVFDIQFSFLYRQFITFII
jgi:hypothetical protein